MSAHKKVINGIAFQTTQIGALEQMRILPTILRLLAGPFGLLVEQLMANKPLIAQMVAKSADATQKKNAGDTFAKAFDMSELKTMNISITPAVVQTAMVAIASELVAGTSDLRDLLNDTFATTPSGLVCLGEDAHFDSVFNGKMHTLMQVLMWVGKLNFADFLNSDLQGNKSESLAPKNARSLRASKQ